jgi:HEAT repeat protein
MRNNPLFDAPLAFRPVILGPVDFPSLARGAAVMRRIRFAGLAALVLLAILPAARAAEPDPLLAQDEKLLRDGHVSPEGPALLTFFRERTLTEAQKAKLADLVKKLGDDDFEVREKASADLVKAGRLAVPLLKPAARDRDAEVARRAADCLRAIESGGELALAAAAARVLAHRKPDGAVEVLLAYLPGAPDEDVEEAVVVALAIVGLRDGKADPALVAALKDKEASRRAAAASIVGRAGAEQRKAVAPLLEDADARVRFNAASALVRAGDKAAMPALIAFVEKGPPAIVWQAEDLLFRIAGPDVKVPALGPGADAAKCRRAWDDWWKDKGAKVDLAKLNLEQAERGVTLICDVNDAVGSTNGRVWECGRDGKVLWQYNQLKGPIDAHLLPGGRILVAEHHGNRITERDRKGTVLWETKTNSNPVACQRLPNGNTFIATYNELLEVNREGKTVFSVSLPGQQIYSATKLRNGHIIYAHSGQAVVELDASGKEVRKVACAGAGAWAGVELLPNGHFLVGLYSAGKVVEIDATSKELWAGTVPSATYAVRLRNGNTLVPSPDKHRVVELDRSGKEVWSVSTEGSARPFRARRY